MHKREKFFYQDHKVNPCITWHKAPYMYIRF